MNEHYILQTLPQDDLRQVMWQFTDRFDLQMVVQSVRSIARGPIARMVAEGIRKSHDWDDKKAETLSLYDQAGITTAFMDPDQGGYLEGPKNLALALVAFELAWVDGGAATCSLANDLALSPIHERGTAEQRDTYMKKCVPPVSGENREIWRGAFNLTEPLPFVGVDASQLGGKVRIASFEDGKEPLLKVEKRGRFITNMDFADFVTAAVDSGDPRIKGSCMVILEKNDPGIFDRGAPVLKLVHQLSSTRDPIFNLTIPASRIIGGYTIKDGTIVPNYTHNEVIEAVFKHTRVTVGLMTTAKLLSSIEPVIRYHRQRFRGGEATPGTPRFELGLQQKEDPLHRLIDIWSTGEASAALGFATARLFDQLEPLDRHKEACFNEQGIRGAKVKMKIYKDLEQKALEFLELSQMDPNERNQARYQELADDKLVSFILIESVANVLCPACKLWNTGYGANMLREAVSLMGGYGITEDCPGFLGYKWMDAQLEATYEGPEAVQRRQLSMTMITPLFLCQYRQWIEELHSLSDEYPQSGAKSLALAMECWLWTLDFLRTNDDVNGSSLYHSNRQGVTFPLADALCWLLANRIQIGDIVHLSRNGRVVPTIADNLDGYVGFFFDLCRNQSARAVGEVLKTCTELVYGYQNTKWLDDPKTVEKLNHFNDLKGKVELSLIGTKLAKDRAALALTKVMIPEALDYPAL